MISTVDDARTEYLNELTAYRIWMDARKAVYGGSSNPMAHWDNHDYDKVMKWNASLQLAEKVLRLTDDEKRDLEHEAGIKHYECEHVLKACCVSR